MEEAPEQPAEPSEGELRAILDERERVRAAARQRVAGRTTRIIAAVIAVVVIALVSPSENREIVASLFREPDPEPSAAPQVEPAKPLEPGEQESIEDQLTNSASIDAKSMVSPDGKIVTKADIGLAMELLNFMQVAPKREDPPATKSEPQPEPEKKAKAP
ncbi:hypothetical protein OKA05_14565 [Luteolibacter arcticus]|uniref:Uncharacterized protein n=1 Tax=Luteolibacter arcticus TaxID=1581411 RepID=A0ABT3GJT7_9BACT|nr:hypothetical protein [Luteolibacter arcticus]